MGIASELACLPLVFKLLELGADPNVITRQQETPVSLARRSRPDDGGEQKEARNIIGNMIRHQGGKDRWQDALKAQHAASDAAKARRSQADSGGYANAGGGGASVQTSDPPIIDVTPSITREV